MLHSMNVRAWLILLLLFSGTLFLDSCTNPTPPEENGEEEEEVVKDDDTGTCFPSFDGPKPPGVPDDQLYYLRQDWPKEPTSLPQDVIDKIHSYHPVTSDNVTEFMYYLRSLVFEDLVPANFDQRQANWFAIPNMGRREAMHGMYDGNNINPKVWDQTQVDTAINFTTDLYNEVSAYTIGQVWGACDPTSPNISLETNQFPEGSMVIKLAMTALPVEQAPFLDGAFSWQVYADPNGNTISGDGPFNPQMVTTHLIQMDCIIKDSVMAPETGWLFSTFVYDQNSPPVDMPAGTPADKVGLYKMTPLGAMWGTDPGVLPPDPLKETVLNPRWANNPPQFIAETMGFNGRLSGPIDDVGNRSSCMTCHSKAQWNTVDLSDDTGAIFSLLNYPEADWSDAKKIPWFVNFEGTESYCDSDVPNLDPDPCATMDPGSDWIGMDYDFVMVAAALNAMQKKGTMKKENILVGKHH